MIARGLSNSKALQFLNLNSYLLLKLGNFFASPDLPIIKNLENIIYYAHSRSTTDLSAILIAVNASEESAQAFLREMVEG